MITLLIIADDFTGALDTGVQFAASGTATRVVTDIQFDYGQVDEKVSVLVMDAETRHLEPEKAYDVVYHITKKAVEQGIPYIYKKTDSGLRGNIGSELAAILDATGRKSLHFFPAFPKMGRITKDGIHYIDGIPVEESVFGKDPFEPVTCSYIPDIIKLQTKIKVRLAEVESGQAEDRQAPEIIVWDAQTDEELEALGRNLQKEGGLSIMAGCAGFASVLPKLLALEGRPPGIPDFVPRFLVICGSVNPITVSQLDYAEHHGFLRMKMSPEEKLEEAYWKSIEGQKRLDQLKELIESNRCSILDSNDYAGGRSTMGYAQEHHIDTEEIRVRIARNLGYIVKELVERGLEATMMITGGDTLMGCMKQMDVFEMEPVCEMGPGIVLSRFRILDAECQLISKSGGFGGEQLLTDLAKQILAEHK